MINFRGGEEPFLFKFSSKEDVCTMILSKVANISFYFIDID